MRVLVIDDSAFMRKVISRMIDSDPDLEVVDTARNGQDGVEKAIKLKPDLITLDVEMPVMDGIEALGELKRKCVDFQPAILMCSSLTSAGSHEALKAMRLGAADVIGKDPKVVGTGDADFRADLVAKLKAIGKTRALRVPAARTPKEQTTARKTAPQAPMTPSSVSRRIPELDSEAFDLVVIGSSTGGPPVLECVMGLLPADLSVPVVVAQHMPSMFTRSLAQRLDASSAVSVVLGQDKMPLHPGTVYIIEGGLHGHVRCSLTGKLSLEINDKPTEAVYKPSVDALFESAAKAVGARCLAAVFTGMGEDGKIGGQVLRERGAIILGQVASTCVVYGMPRAIIEAGIAHSALSPEMIANTIAQLSPTFGQRAGSSGAPAAA